MVELGQIDPHHIDSGYARLFSNACNAKEKPTLEEARKAILRGVRIATAALTWSENTIDS